MVKDTVELPGTLLEVIGEAQHGMRLIHLGSAAEYGNTNADRVAPTAQTCPASTYGALKLAASRLVLDAVSQDGLDGCVLRVFNPVGAWAPHTSLVGKVVSHLSQTPDLALRLGPLSGSRDYIAAPDVAEAILLAATKPGVPAVLNVGKGETTATAWIVQELIRLAGWQGELITDAVPINSTSGAGGSPAADISLTTEALGWRPRTSLESALTNSLRAASQQ
jgi:nucleoside-diphosphate-sugar epimerase